jgi:hypothetical protein
MRGDAGVSDAIMNSTAYTRSQTLWRTSKLEDYNGLVIQQGWKTKGFQIKVLNGNFYTTRPVGRPRTRWADVVQKDALQLLR